MKAISLGLVMLLFTAAMLAQNANDLYQQGLARETAGDIRGAIQIFERIVREFPNNRALTARALVQLGEWSDVLGQTHARTYYERVTREYNDQAAAAADARRWLAEKGPALLEVVPPYTSDPFGFALSPDGRSLVFVATVNGTTSLWLRELGSGRQAPIPGTASTRFQAPPHGANPFWSPEGLFVAYFDDHKLKRVSVNGGTPAALADVARNLGGSWGDGVIVYAPDTAGPLFRVSADGGPTVPVTKSGPPPASHRYPMFLPDGRRFLINVVPNGFAIGSLDNPEVRNLALLSAGGRFLAPHSLVVAQGGLFLYDLDFEKVAVRGAPTQISAEMVGNLDIPNTQVLSVSTSATGDIEYRVTARIRRRVVLRDRSGREIDPLTTVTVESPATPRISPDGKTVAVHLGGFTALLIQIGSGKTRQVTLRSSSTIRGFALVTGRGTCLRRTRPRVAGQYTNDIAGRYANLYELQSSGNARRLTEAAENQAPLDWHGNSILIAVDTDDGNEDLYVLSASELTSKPIPVAVGPGRERNARFGPHGKWIVYDSDDVGARSEVFLQPFPGSATTRRQISVAGGTMPEWGAGGRELYYLAPDNRLMVVDVTVSAAGADLQLGKPRVLFTTSVPDGSTYMPTPDGQRFIVNEPGGSIPIKILRGVTKEGK